MTRWRTFAVVAESYLTVVGTAGLVRDPAGKARPWKTDWAGFYKDANRGDDCVLIRVKPSRLEVSAPSLGLTNDPATWRPVILELGR